LTVDEVEVALVAVDANVVVDAVDADAAVETVDADAAVETVDADAAVETVDADAAVETVDADAAVETVASDAREPRPDVTTGVDGKSGVDDMSFLSAKTSHDLRPKSVVRRLYCALAIACFQPPLTAFEHNQIRTLHGCIRIA
jgi:hypothetical protein